MYNSDKTKNLPIGKTVILQIYLNLGFIYLCNANCYNDRAYVVFLMTIKKQQKSNKQ